MIDAMVNDHRLGGQLLAIARDPKLRQATYDRLGEYCHQCRNRLNSLKLSLYLARREATGVVAETWARLENHYLELERLVERLQVICRPMVLSRVTLGLDLVVEDRREEWSRWLAERGGELRFEAPARKAVATLDVVRMVSALNDLARWRGQVITPGTSARFRWRVEAGRAHLDWEEDRPRSKFAARSEPGSSPEGVWTLPILARVLDAHDGDLRVDELDGWRLEVSWPSE